MIPITRPWLPPLPEYEALLRDIWSSRMLSNFGEFAERLEHIATDYLGVRALVVASGDIGLTLSIAALRVPEGSACLLPSFTFNSTVNAVLWNRLRPVFVDIDPETLNLDPKDAREVASRHDVGLMIATHVFGNPADTGSLAALATELDVPLLFDAAHGYGARRDGTPVGQFGDVEVFSLSGTKPVTTGEGGLVTSRDPEFLEQILYLRAYGFRGDYNSRMVGLNGKMSELHAALGVLTLDRIEDALAARMGHVQRYTELLGDTPGVAFQAIRPTDRSTYKDFALLFSSQALRTEVEAALAAAAVQTKRYFRPCHQMDAFRGFADRPLAATEDVYERVLCIPLFEDLRPEELSLIAATVQRACLRWGD